MFLDFSPIKRDLIDLTIADECTSGIIEWKAAVYNGYMRVLFESGEHNCKQNRDSEYRVCISTNRQINMVWDVTKGVSNRNEITLFRNSKNFQIQKKKKS